MRVWSAALILCLVVSISASAQSTQRLRDRDPDLDGAKRIAAELQQANLHYGAFYLWSRLRISDIGFVDEVYLPTADHGSGLSLSIEAPQRLYFVPHKKTIFTAEVVPGYSFFGEEFGDGQFNYSARADAHFLFNHLYLDAYTILSDQLRAQVSDVNRVATQKDSESGLSGEFKYSSRTSALFSARYRESEYPQERFQPLNVPVNLLDRVERNGRVALHHKTFPLTSLFVAGEASDYSFRRATYKDSKRTWVGAGFVRNAGRTGMRIEAGPARLDFADPSQRDYSGILGQADISRGHNRWNMTLGAERDLGFSIFLNNNYYVATVGRARFDYSATRRLTLRAGTSHERDDYDVEVNGLLRRDTISFSWVGFIYSFRRVRAGIDVGWYERNSNIGDQEQGIRWLLNLSFSPTI